MVRGRPGTWPIGSGGSEPIPLAIFERAGYACSVASPIDTLAAVERAGYATRGRFYDSAESTPKGRRAKDKPGDPPGFPAANIPPGCAVLSLLLRTKGELIAACLRNSSG